MQRTLSEHIARLEEKVINLRRELQDDSLTAHQRSERQIAISNSEEALKLFRKAYNLEQKVSGSGLSPTG